MHSVFLCARKDGSSTHHFFANEMGVGCAPPPHATRFFRACVPCRAARRPLSDNPIIKHLQVQGPSAPPTPALLLKPRMLASDSSAWATCLPDRTDRQSSCVGTWWRFASTNSPLFKAFASGRELHCFPAPSLNESCACLPQIAACGHSGLPDLSVIVCLQMGRPCLSQPPPPFLKAVRPWLHESSMLALHSPHGQTAGFR